MVHWLLIYDLAPDYLDRRPAYRDLHLTLAEAFARADPYVTNGLVARWHVRPWLTVAGAGAANPVRP